MAYAVYLGCDRGCTLDREDWGCCGADASSKTGSREPTRFEGPFGEYRTQAPGRAPPPCAPTGPTSSRGRPARRVSGVRACPRCARPPRASAACPWTAPLVLSRAARKRSSTSTLPDSTSETLRPRHGAAQAPRYEGCSVLRDPHRDGEHEGEHAPSDLASSHMAWNRRRGRTSECRVAVPVVTKRW